MRVEQEIADDILGYGPLEPFLRDATITEIMVNGADDVYVERNGKIERANVHFTDDAHVLRIIDRIVSQVGRRVDEGSPMVDARLPDGSRVNAIIPPLSLRGPTLTIRKFSREPVHARRPRVVRRADAGRRDVPRLLRPRQGQHPDLRRHRLRQDDPPQRALRRSFPGTSGS